MAISQVRKRDGSIVPFEPVRIRHAIHRALFDAGIADGKKAGQLTKQVVKLLEKRFPKAIPDVENIQDTVEIVLKKWRPRVAAIYSEFRRKKAEIREARKKFGIEEKLTYNAMQVLERRYLLRDGKGKIIETPAKMFRRVARAVAAVEKKYGGSQKKMEREFFNIMSRLEFLPNSPTMFNAGAPLGQLSACFSAEQPILCNPGFKEIHSISVGDKVVTHTGHLMPVTRTFVRTIDDYLYKVRVQGLLNPALSVTAEHPILAIKRSDVACKRADHGVCNGMIKKHCLKCRNEYKNDCRFIGKVMTEPRWIRACDLEMGDFVALTPLADVEDVDNLLLTDYIGSSRFVVDRDRVYQKNTDPRKRSGELSKHVKPLINNIRVNQDLMKLFGYYLSEGDIDDGKCVRFTFRSDETKYAREVIRIAKKKFDIDSRIEKASAGEWINVRLHSIIIARFFEKIFSKGFDKKDIPMWISLLPREKQLALLTGLFRGDGCHANGKKQDVIYIELSNRNLILKIWNILLRLGYDFNISGPYFRSYSMDGKRKMARNASYRLTAAPNRCLELIKSANMNKFVNRKYCTQNVHIGGRTFRPISSIEKVRFKGDVFNLEVDKDHSYVAGGIAVHNCFVLPVPDSLDGIFTAVKNTALIEQSGGGVGFSFSRLRPKGDVVRSTMGIASGPVSFMRVFDVATDVIKAGGKRRGAMMGVLRVDHPDIIEFITAKRRQGFLSNFNISVAVTDRFMAAVKTNKDYTLINPRRGKATIRLNARFVWNLIIENAWKTGDPGVIFIDEINRRNPTSHVGLIESTNPCGEVLLHPGESCNLGSINLTKMLKKKNEKYQIDWDKLKRSVQIAVRFLDDVVDANKYPLPEIEAATKANRRIGLGVMGLADMLILLGIRYDSKNALGLAERVMKFIADESHKVSVELGKQRGNFPNFKGSLWQKRGYPAMRNATTTVIAPTGTLSIIAGVSSGIEPLFAISFVRRILEGRRLIEVNRIFEKVAKERGFYSTELMMKIAKKGSVQGLKGVPKDIQKLFVTALEIRPEWHVRMQAAFQKHTDNSVSKTINFPANAKPADVKKAYELAYKLKCKGITVYRYGSKPEQVLYIGPQELVHAEAEFAGGCPTPLCPVPS